ncbi:MAG: YbaB/EbfC family nucleoid-associated protein [Desulfovibrio sp.]|jgi:DNA-binding YbaB/EbfC family protein|nr:YbaB/EbfC family nucleoid-associated protein [Desulfovibrio sp.]
MKNMNDLLRQAQIMQQKVQKVEEEAASRTFEASSGGGMVVALVTGKMEVRKLTIDPKIVAEGDAEMLQDLIIAAVNEALRIAKDTVRREMEAISNGIRLPGMG